jgi:hypothetical protein
VVQQKDVVGREDGAPMWRADANVRFEPRPAATAERGTEEAGVDDDPHESSAAPWGTAPALGFHGHVVILICEQTTVDVAGLAPPGTARRRTTTLSDTRREPRLQREAA